jgi:hypothetical protein
MGKLGKLGKLGKVEKKLLPLLPLLPHPFTSERVIFSLISKIAETF